VIRLWHDAGVVVEAVQLTIGCKGVIDHRLGVGLVRDVGPDEGRFAASRLDQLYGLGAGRFAVFRDHDPSTLGGKQLGRHATHPTSPAGDDRDLVLEPHCTPLAFASASE
jgi:hypothetical protein